MSYTRFNKINRHEHVLDVQKRSTRQISNINSMKLFSINIEIYLITGKLIKKYIYNYNIYN